MAHTLIGTVTSDKRDKTITVTVVSRETHPLYRKQFTNTRKYTAHDANNEASTGDRVQIVESRPISKTKTWVLDKIVERARGTVEVKEEVHEAQVPEKDVKSNTRKIEETKEEAEAPKDEVGENE